MLEGAPKRVLDEEVEKEDEAEDVETSEARGSARDDARCVRLYIVHGERAVMLCEAVLQGACINARRQVKIRYSLDECHGFSR